jgi:methylenetetrahydrofolate dehydrogenase (NADP+) / methenyltetrahydrofolate cyclohydrolase
MSQLLDGIVVRDQILEKLKHRVARLNRAPGLAVVLVGSDPASEQYVRNKILACQKLGIYSEKITPPVDSTTEDMLKVVEQINRNPKIDGVLVQMPLPKQIDVHRVLEAVDPKKDADGFHPTNVGHLVAGRPAPRACTPSGIIELLKYYKVKMEGRKAVVLGRSDIVGKPMAMMLLQENATVTICHSRTVNLEDECRTADILVTAMGRPAIITANFISPGATVIDVGTTLVSDRDEAIRLGKEAEFIKKGHVFVGDVNPIDARHGAGAHTPVPGGVGPLTIAMLISNTVMLSEDRQGIREAVRVSA